jgi:antitoxin component of MazEF toxin-antitoxin module
MRARVQRWGNRLALRIPKAFATETALEAGSEVELTLDEGRLVVTPVASPPTIAIIFSLRSRRRTCTRRWTPVPALETRRGEERRLCA